MVYVYSRQSELNKFIGKKLSCDEIEDTLADLGMDVKGRSDENDPEIKIEITAEKMDMVSTVGIARTIKYYRSLEKKIPKYSLKHSGLKVKVLKSAKDTRPKTVAAILRNVPMTRELLNEMIAIQEKIHESFGRHRKKAAIGIYPLNNIEFPITFGGENPKDIKFKPLEAETEMNGEEILEKHDMGKKYGHLIKDQKFYPVFRDAKNRVLSMPPIINSHETGKVLEKHKDLFIECSGHNLTHLDNILKVLCTTFSEMGAEIESVNVEYEEEETYVLSLDNKFETLSLDYVNKLIGVEIKEEDVEKLLNKQMYGLKSIKNRVLEVEIPCFRTDIWNDCDIADDIARAYGYNNIIPKFPNISSVGKKLESSIEKDQFTDLMTKLGYTELYTFMLTSSKEQFTLMNNKESNHVKILDSAEEGINMMRTSILPEVLKALNFNRKNKYPQKVFENGITIQVDSTKDTGARNETHLCVAIADPRANYTQIKEVLDTLMKLKQIKVEIRDSKNTSYIEGRQAEIFVRGDSIGFIGELHPQVLENFGLIVPVVSFEINLDLLTK